MDSFVVYDENGVGHRVREREREGELWLMFIYRFSDSGINYKQFH